MPRWCGIGWVACRRSFTTSTGTHTCMGLQWGPSHLHRASIGMFVVCMSTRGILRDFCICYFLLPFYLYCLSMMCGLVRRMVMIIIVSPCS